MNAARRRLLAAAGALPLAGLAAARPGRASGLAPLPPPADAPAAGPATAIRLLSCRGDGAGGYRASGLDPDGRLRFDLPLPGRGHGAAVHPDGRIAVFLARRPGDFLLAVDLEAGGPLALAHTPAERHCYGHGVFSRDGSLLYATENAIETGEGRIGVWELGDGRSPRRIGELPTHGIGPHELLLAPDGERLIVANGGILTRPETGRAKLNLDTMTPALVDIDRRDGRLLAEHRLPPELHRLSIRHLAQGADGTVCAALQYEGPPHDRPPLVAFRRPGGDLEPVAAPAEVQDAMRNYCGSAAADPSGAWFAVSAPRGNLVTFWDARGRFAGRTRIPDGCGVAPGDAPGTFVLSSGTGSLYRHDCRSGLTDACADAARDGDLPIQWDNHLTART